MIIGIEYYCDNCKGEAHITRRFHIGKDSFGDPQVTYICEGCNEKFELVFVGRSVDARLREME